MINYETILPTTGGWLRAQDIKPGDYLFDERGEPTAVLASDIHENQTQFKIEFYNKDAIFVTNDQQLINTWSPKEKAVSLNTMKPHTRIKMAKYLNGPETEAPLDPYVFGLFFFMHNSTASESIRVSVKESELSTAIKKLNWAGIEVLKKEKKKVKRSKARNYMLTINPPIWSKLSEVFYKKPTTLPDYYVYGSYKQKKDLIDSLFASYRNSVGWDKKSHETIWIQFASNETLTMQVAEIMKSIGYTIEVIKNKDKFAIHLKSKRKPKSYNIKAVEQIDNEPAVDIKTKAGTFLISENFIVCQN